MTEQREKNCSTKKIVYTVYWLYTCNKYMWGSDFEVIETVERKTTKDKRPKNGASSSEGSS